MAKAYSCACFAVPKKLLSHLADIADDEDDRCRLREQVQHTQALRGRRAEATLCRRDPPKGVKPLQRSVFTAGGATFLPGTLLRDEDDPPTRDRIADEAYDNVGIAMTFFAEVFKRDSIDNKGMRVDVSVHYGNRYVNAMWTGEQMLVGDGDGRTVRNLAGSLGIIAHEFVHGVTQHLVAGGLGVVRMPGMPPQLKGEAGALNESFSDVFASMIKQWHRGQTVDQADWLMGEDILAPHVGKAVRSLKDPGNRKITWSQDDQIRDYRKYLPTHDTHAAAGIASHAFYRAARELGGHSWDALGPVWLKGFDKLRARATFLDAAHATVGVAASLHGKASSTHKAVKDAWRGAGVLA